VNSNRDQAASLKEAFDRHAGEYDRLFSASPTASEMRRRTCGSDGPDVANWELAEQSIVARAARSLRKGFDRVAVEAGLRACSRMTLYFGISSSRHLRPLLNRRSSK
jgi:hypothetical protein